MEAITNIVTNVRLEMARAWRAFCRNAARYWSDCAVRAHERVQAILRSR